MTHDEPQETNRQADSETPRYVRRRQFLSAGAAMGATVFAGCATETEVENGGGGSTPATASNGTTAARGTFRLLISDQPVAIADFDELSVSFDRARIFRADDSGGDDATEALTSSETGSETVTETEAGTDTEPETQTPTATETVPASRTTTQTATETGTEDDDTDDGDERGFFVIDLDGATVDLTQVVGKKAISVFDGELSEGRYAKVELYAASVEGIVDGEQVDVTIPSGKLQIVKPFEVVAGETLTFVFDINVVKKGRTGDYNLLPVISESGVAGEDVDVDVIGSEESDSDGEETEEEETDGEETEEEETDGEETEEEETDGEETEMTEDGGERGNGGDRGQPDDAGGER